MRAATSLLGSWGTSANTGEAWSVLARWLVLLLASVSSSVLSSVTAVSVTSWGAVSTTGTTADGSLWSSWSLVGGWDDLSWEVQVLSEVLETLVGEGVVVPLPAELGVDEALGGQALHSLDDVEVSDLQLWVLDFEVLGGDENAVIDK